MKRKYLIYLLVAMLTLIAASGCKKKEEGLKLVNTSWALTKMETNNADFATLIATYQSLPEAQRPVFGLTFLSELKLAFDINYKGSPTISYNTDYAYKSETGQLAVNIESNGMKIPTNIGYLSAPSDAVLQLKGAISVEQQQMLVLLLSTKNPDNVLEKAILDNIRSVLQSNITRSQELSYTLTYQRR